MNKVKNASLIFIATSMLWSCNQGGSSVSSYTAQDNATKAEAAATEVDSDLQQRKYIKTASIDAKVSDVSAATVASERWVHAAKGVVLYSNTAQQVTDVNEEKYHGDSIKKIERVSVNAELVVRIPTVHLDSLLTFVRGQSITVHNRSIQLEDASIAILEQQLKKTNTLDNSDIANAKAKSSNTDDVLAIAQAKGDARANDIDLQVQTSQLNDKINYSDVTIKLSQHDIVLTTIEPDVPLIMAPHYGYELQRSLSFGFTVIRKLSLVFMSIWPLWILGIGIGFFLWKKNQGKKIATP